MSRIGALSRLAKVSASRDWRQAGCRAGGVWRKGQPGSRVVSFGRLSWYVESRIGRGNAGSGPVSLSCCRVRRIAMAGTVSVEIEAEQALRPEAVDAALATVISRIKTRSHAAGRTDEMVDAELAAASAARLRDGRFKNPGI